MNSRIWQQSPVCNTNLNPWLWKGLKFLRAAIPEFEIYQYYDGPSKAKIPGRGLPKLHFGRPLQRLEVINWESKTAPNLWNP